MTHDTDSGTERRMTFAGVAALWSESRSRTVKRSTMCMYRGTLEKVLLPRFGGMTEITEEDAQRFVTEQCASGLARHTVRDRLTVLRSVVFFGSRRGVFPYRAWELLWPPQEGRKILPLLAEGDHRRLLAYLAEQPDARNIGVLLALCTGMRIGEVCGLMWDDVDFHTRTITVRRTVMRLPDAGTGRTARVEQPPKTKTSYREIPIGSVLLKALKAVRKQSPSPYVVLVPCDFGTPHSAEPRSYREYFNRLCVHLGIPRIVFHGLRHTFATRCIESGCDYKTVSSILGHSDVAITMNLYVHPTAGQKLAAVERMTRRIGRKTAGLAGCV